MMITRVKPWVVSPKAVLILLLLTGDLLNHPCHAFESSSSSGGSSSSSLASVIQEGYTAVGITLQHEMAEFEYLSFALDVSLSVNCSTSQVTVMTYSPTLIDGLMSVDLLFVDRPPDGLSSLDLATQLIFGTTKIRSLVPLTTNYNVNSAGIDTTVVAPQWALDLVVAETNTTASDSSGLSRRLPLMSFVGMCIVMGLMMVIAVVYFIYYAAMGRHDRDALRYIIDDKKHSTGCSTWVLGSNRTISEGMEQGQLLGLLKQEDNVKTVACGHGHMVVISSVGGVFVAGDNYHGQLGLGHNRHVFKFERNPFFDGVEIDSVVCGVRHTAIVTKNGELYTFGAGEDGALGQGDLEDHWLPCRVEYFGAQGNPIKGIASGDYHVVVLAGDGLYSWGWNEYGQLMLGEAAGTHSQCEPQWVEYFADYELHIREFVCGPHHTLVLCGEWELYGCGGNGCGQLGLGHYEDIFTPELTPLFETSTKIHSISTHYHTLVACDDGVYCCGEGTGFKTGVDHEEYIAGLTWISALESNEIVKVHAGHEHSFFTADDHGTIFACGSSEDGGALGFQSGKRTNPVNGEVQELIRYNHPVRVDLEELLGVPKSCRTSGSKFHSRRQQLLEVGGNKFPSVRQLILAPEYTIVLVRLGVKLDRSALEASKGSVQQRTTELKGSKYADKKKADSGGSAQEAPGTIKTEVDKKSNPLRHISNDPTEPPRLRQEGEEPSSPTGTNISNSIPLSLSSGDSNGGGEERQPMKGKKGKKSKGWE